MKIKVICRIMVSFLLLGASAKTLMAVTPMPVISRNLPAFASANNGGAPDSNDNDYGTAWRSYSIPAWLAYDLSSLPLSQRAQVLVVYYNNSYSYNTTYGVHYNNARDYTLQANAAAGGNPPADGWVTLATVTGNTYHSRQHLVNLSGYQWLRMNVTASDGSVMNDDVSFNLDVHDASQGVTDSWIFYGDSITTGGMATYPQGGADTFAKLIQAGTTGNFPAAENGGMPFQKSSDAAGLINEWLAVFPGKYVTLNFGTNDGCSDPTAYYGNMETAVKAVLTAGKIPVIPTIPWARRSDYQTCLPNLNAKIVQLYAAYPQIVPGPDLWTFFQSHQELISPDDLHPSEAGFAAYRQQWAIAMLANVYAVSDTTPPASPKGLRSLP